MIMQSTIRIDSIQYEKLANTNKDNVEKEN